MTATTPVHAGAGRTERAAAKRAARWATSLEAKVLALAAFHGEEGITAKEAREELGLPVEKHYSVAPRLSAMKRKGWVEASGVAREDFQAYVATPAGRARIEEVATCSTQ